MSFLVCKLCKSGFYYITTHFGHGQCFIWDFIVLAFMETTRLNTNYFSNFSSFGNDTILICKLYMSNLYIKTLILDMFQVLGNIYVDRLLLVAFVKYILSQIYSHCFQNCTFWYFLEIVEIFVFWRKRLQSLLIFMFIYPKTSNFQNSRIVSRRKLPDTSMKKKFNVLSISLQYTLSFKWPDFALKCLATIKFKTSVWNFSISETGRNYNSLFTLVDSNWVIIME